MTSPPMTPSTPPQDAAPMPTMRAFPSGQWDGHEPDRGMTLRDWFAGQALSGLAGFVKGVKAEVVACDCYMMADAMLAEGRLKPDTQKMEIEFLLDRLTASLCRAIREAGDDYYGRPATAGDFVDAVLRRAKQFKEGVL